MVAQDKGRRKASVFSEIRSQRTATIILEYVKYYVFYGHPNWVAWAVVLFTVEHVILFFESLLDPAFEFDFGCRIGFLGWSSWSGWGCGGWYESWADFNNRFNFSSWVTSWLNLVTSTESSILSSKQITFRHSLKNHWELATSRFWI